jgi:DNA primase
MRELPSWPELIRRFGLKVTRAGASFRGPCPLHGGSNGTAFVITPGKGFFCHACGENGGVLRFLELMRDPEATEWAETRRGLGTVETAAGQSWKRSPAHIRGDERLPEVAPIGPLVADHRSLRARGVAPELARAFGCGYYEGSGRMWKRIVFPVHDNDGRLVGHLGRAIGRIEPRYLCSAGLRKSQLLFNEHRARASGVDEVIVVEGPFDVLAVHGAGWPNVVATMGCTVSATQRRRLAMFDRVRILFDGDAAGQEAAATLATLLGARASIITLPPSDPASLNPAVLQALIASC